MIKMHSILLLKTHFCSAWKKSCRMRLRENKVYLFQLEKWTVRWVKKGVDHQAQRVLINGSKSIW